jgi:uncharacterized protein YbaA (DUF1428 family)
MYVEGFVTAVPKDNKQKYEEHAKKFAGLLKKFGATRIVECWQNDIPHGKKTDFYGAVQANENEDILFSWVEYPSKDIRDESWKKMEELPEMKDMSKNMPFDGSRMIFGGFESIVDIR